MSIRDLHLRYLQQASWTKLNRDRLYELAGIKNAGRVLEVGSGTGVITAELKTAGPDQVYGIDIDPGVARFAHKEDQISDYVVGDGATLPFSKNAFDVVLSHFLLLWVHDPVKILTEMLRVTAPGGYVLATAEPDYGGRIDFPRELAVIGEMQAKSLERQGANVQLGRRLRSLFKNAGLMQVIAGILGGEWKESDLPDGFENEWETLSRDLIGDMSGEELSRYRALDREAQLSGERILFVPTFYAIGRVGGSIVP
jgi:ubiquinone/menaquinone biosynthesis C-methylase UbiE